MNDYQICTRCIMDTSDPDIFFDEHGVCNHCHSYDEKVKKLGYIGKESEEKLDEILRNIKIKQAKRDYDCVVGISGGVDSAYLTYLAHQKGLRILAIHVDAGWNSQIAVENIQKICKSMNVDLYTVVVDWETIKELQRAYMFSGLPNLDIPQDHAFSAAVYRYAKKNRVKYVLNGSNLATEGILPKAWGYTAIDYKSIKNIYKKLGRKKSLRKYPHFNLWQYFFYQKYLKIIRPLNYISYSKKEAVKNLKENFGWEYYGGKHWESRFTKFFQSYYLPKKFGCDKNRAHLSSLIVGGEMTREEALEEIGNSKNYTEEEMIEDRDYILKKLDISLLEWDNIMKNSLKSENNYRSNKKIIEFLVKQKNK